MNQYFPEQRILDSKPKMQRVEFVMAHHSGGSANQSKESLRDHFLITRAHEGYWWIGYHVVIWPDGTVLQTRPFDNCGGHCPQDGMNSKAIGVCFMGDYSNESPSTAAWEAFEGLLKTLYTQFGLTPEKVITHRSIKPTICPGDYIAGELASHAQKAFAPEPEHTAHVCDISGFSSEDLVDELSIRIKSQK